MVAVSGTIVVWGRFAYVERRTAPLLRTEANASGSVCSDWTLSGKAKPGGGPRRGRRVRIFPRRAGGKRFFPFAPRERPALRSAACGPSTVKPSLRRCITLASDCEKSTAITQAAAVPPVPVTPSVKSKPSSPSKSDRKPLRQRLLLCNRPATFPGSVRNGQLASPW